MADNDTSGTDDDKNTDDNSSGSKDDKNTGGGDANGDDDRPISPEEAKRMRAALKKANDEAAQSRHKLKEIEDRDKSDSEKLSERASSAEQRATEAEQRAMRLEVALDQGLTTAQAKRLVGDTVEELSADADELVASFRSDGDGKTPPPTNRPNENLTSGGDRRDEPEPDPAKVADQVPRF